MYYSKIKNYICIMTSKLFLNNYLLRINRIIFFSRNPKSSSLFNTNNSKWSCCNCLITNMTHWRYRRQYLQHNLSVGLDRGTSSLEYRYRKWIPFRAKNFNGMAIMVIYGCSNIFRNSRKTILSRNPISKRLIILQVKSPIISCLH